MRHTLRLLTSVFKLRIGLAITLSAMAGLAIAPGPGPGGWQIAALGLAVFLSSASAGAFNQYVERDLDARMTRTRMRPFVTGELRPGAVWPVSILAILAAAVALATLATNPMAGLYVFLGAFFYGVVYTVWLKRRTWWNIVIGGLAGSFAVLAGAAAVNPSFSTGPLLLALVLFLWTPPHFWSLAMYLREDYARAGVPMLPVVFGDRRAAWIILAHTVALVAVSLLPALYGSGPFYVAGAMFGGLWFLRCSVDLVRQPGPAQARVNFHASLIQLSLLLAGVIADAALA